jgi:hypothetical protein
MTIKPRTALTTGRTYATEDVLKAMITESDNNAAEALGTHAPNDALADVYGNFDIPVVTSEDANIMSPKMYMRIFRILYNSSYLERSKSQQTLELLAHTSFTDGLKSELPMQTVVSHKFGEREIYVDGKALPLLVQLHDCGIVYYPHAPYGICIMTEGGDIQKLKVLIARLSKSVYAEVKSGALAK